MGPATSDDAGVYALGATALVATADFITPFCDDPYRFGRVAAANSMSDVFAMGGEVLFALNICCFPEGKAPAGVYTSILQGGLDAVSSAGGVVLGGHSVGDPELKYGLAVVGRAGVVHAGDVRMRHLCERLSLAPEAPAPPAPPWELPEID